MAETNFMPMPVVPNKEAVWFPDDPTLFRKLPGEQFRNYARIIYDIQDPDHVGLLSARQVAARTGLYMWEVRRARKLWNAWMRAHGAPEAEGKALYEGR
jgi:hypothetical protein